MWLNSALAFAVQIHLFCVHYITRRKGENLSFSRNLIFPWEFLKFLSLLVFHSTLCFGIFFHVDVPEAVKQEADLLFHCIQLLLCQISTCPESCTLLPCFKISKGIHVSQKSHEKKETIIISHISSRKGETAKKGRGKNTWNVFILLA